MADVQGLSVFVCRLSHVTILVLALHDVAGAVMQPAEAVLCIDGTFSRDLVVCIHHRYLCASFCRYASDINSPLRHVRTRIYFTSESHIHSLINVLR
jgi:hypothetical protein